MKFYLSILLFLIVSFTANADNTFVKPFSLGLGLYQSVISVDDARYADDELSGLGFSLGYSISDQFALRGTYYSLEHDDFSEVDSSGYDLVGYLGTGLATYGFKAYIGGGLFKDKWQVAGFSESFSGLQMSGGLGYNWDSVSLDFNLSLRDAGDYEDFVNDILGDNIRASAVSGMLLMSARF